MFQRFIQDDGGATAIEYALIVSLIALVMIAGLRAYAGAVNARWDMINTAVTQANGG